MGLIKMKVEGGVKESGHWMLQIGEARVCLEASPGPDGELWYGEIGKVEEKDRSLVLDWMQETIEKIRGLKPL